MIKKIKTRVEEHENTNTIFDDVFRTIAQKMPELLISLINEVFHTSYSEDDGFEQLRNEHYEKFGKIITDSLIRIGGHLYHLECQSKKDGNMVLRMIEYDFSIAVEHSKGSDGNGRMIITFPESCVLYIRNHRSVPDYHEAVVRFADGQQVLYKVPVLKVQEYTVNDIFEKRLLMLLPYHILRYEHFLKGHGEDRKKADSILREFEEINCRLAKTTDSADKSSLYVDLINYISKIADYIISDNNPVREKWGDVMGGQVLKLKSEELVEQGIEQGVEQGEDRLVKLLNRLKELGENEAVSSVLADREYRIEMYKKYGI